MFIKPLIFTLFLVYIPVAILPSSPLYFLKAAKENFELRLTSYPREKMYKRLNFSGNRLSEAKQLLMQREDLIQQVMERYITDINSLPDQYQEKDDLGLIVKETLKEHSQTLEKMYTEVQSYKAKIAIRSVISRLSHRKDLPVQLKKSLCEFLEKDASSSALNAPEKYVITKRAKECLNSLKP